MLFQSSTVVTRIYSVNLQPHFENHCLDHGLECSKELLNFKKRLKRGVEKYYHGEDEETVEKVLTSLNYHRTNSIIHAMIYCDALNIKVKCLVLIEMSNDLFYS